MEKGALVAPYESAITLLCTIPGVDGDLAIWKCSFMD